DRTASPLTDCPAKAPSRSTTCSQRKPIAAKWRACVAGSSLNTVALAISPRTRRTQAPPFRSIAGNRITATRSRAGVRRRRLVEALVVIMPGDEFALDQRIERMRAPAAVAEALVKMDRRPLGVAQIEIEHQQSELARQLLDLQHDAAADPVTARPGRDKGAGHRAGHRLRLVVARRARQLGRTADHPVEPADDEAALGHQQ